MPPISGEMGWLESDPTLKVGNIALRIESERLKIIGSNLANAEVPKYRALKCDFKRALSRNLKPDEPSTELIATHPAHFSTGAAKGVKLPTEVEKVSLRVDQNTVDVEAELAELSMLQVRYYASLNALAHRIKLLKMAMSSRE